jgi:hypothetical protein
MEELLVTSHTYIETKKYSRCGIAVENIAIGIEPLEYSR